MSAPTLRITSEMRWVTDSSLRLRNSPDTRAAPTTPVNPVCSRSWPPRAWISSLTLPGKSFTTVPDAFTTCHMVVVDRLVAAQGPSWEVL